MTRQYFLGEDGEAAYTRLERSLQLGPDSGRASVASDSVDVRYEVRRRVGEILRVEVIRPGADVVRRIHQVVEEAGSPVLVWIEAEPGVGVESEAWRQTYAALNMGRDILDRKGPLSLVLAGPVALDQQVKMRAPDLTSVMRPMLVLGRQLDPLEEESGPIGGRYVPNFGDSVGDRQQDVIAHEVADVLARAVPDVEEAKLIAKRARFPPEHLPEHKTAKGFWSDVVDQAFRGRLRPEALVAEAAKQLPHDEELLEWKQKLRRTIRPRLDDLRVRLRRVAATKSRNHVFAHMPVATPKPSGLVWDAFVPLDFEAHDILAGRDDSARRPGLRSLGVTIDLETLVERIDPVGGIAHADSSLTVSPRRVLAILGDPGSGKSTLCRWLAATIAEREPGRVPILVDAVDWMSSEGSTSLMDAMVCAVDSGVSKMVDIADLKSLCEDGRIVLLVDGYDEPARADARSRMRGMLEVFSSEYPEISVVVTSRVEGYLEAPLPAPCQTLVIEPFDEGKLEDFVRQWYAMVEDDPEARARGRAELTAALAAEPRAREMARSPLLATLIAEVHHHQKAPLPGRRSELYDLVVELLLVTRVRKGHLFAEMTPDEQRARLERFALWLQEQRSADDGADIMFGREDFVREVTASGATREAISRRQARQWLEWLVRETGLLVEPSSGRYSFSHLSLMEYLAAQGLLRSYEGRQEELDRHLASVAYHAQWRETILLALGARAEDRNFVSSAAHAILGARGSALYVRDVLMLHLGLLMEDVDISDVLRLLMLNHSKIFMFGPDFEWTSEQLGRVMRHSRRHGEAVRAWVQSCIASDDADTAVHMAAASPRALQPEHLLRDRADAEDVVPAFLDLSPVDLGTWALNLPKKVLLKWAAEANPTATFRMSLPRLSSADVLTRLWSLALLVGCELGLLFGSRNHWGKEAAIEWRHGREVIRKTVMPSYWFERTAHIAHRPLRRTELIGTGSARKALAAIAVEASHLRDIDSLSRYYDLPWNVIGGFSEEEVLTPEFPQRLLRKLDVNKSWLAAPADAPAPKRPDAENAEMASMTLESSLAETHAARLMMPYDRLSWERIRRRLDNLFIHDFFDGLVDLALEHGTEYDCLPLLLALGFSQYQTTWTWPRSHHWKQWFSSPPPEDWLAAYFWHLCWAVGDVERYTQHYAAAQACLDRTDWPELAAELRAYAIRPMTVEEWQRNDDAPPPTTPAPEA